MHQSLQMHPPLKISDVFQRYIIIKVNITLMKKSTLKNRQSVTVIMLLSFLLAGGFSASAGEYQSMIRYDRVWEHIYIHWNDTRAYHVRFAGTEEINGKTYHRLEAFREIRYTYDYDTKPKILSVNNDYYEHEGYLREEDGKVYTLVAIDDTNPDYSNVVVYTPDIPDPDSYRIEERVLYDFTCKEGESYTGLHIDGGWGQEMDYKIMTIEPVEIEGVDHRLLRGAIYDDWLEAWVDFVDQPIVEGIGIAGNGCLTTINFYHMPTCPCMNHIFNRVLSMDGKVIYRAAEDCVEIPVNDFLGVDGISEITDQPEKDAPIYDILGRRIAKPAPGQLYIQGGKKHIAK